MAASLGTFLGRTLAQVKVSSSVLDFIPHHHRSFVTTISAAVAARNPKVTKPYVPSPAAKAKIYNAVKSVFEADKKRIPRPPTAVQLYAHDVKGTAPPGLKVGEIFSLRRDEYEKLSKARKEKYEKEAKKLQDAYNADKVTREGEKEKHQRPLTPFNFYVRQRMPTRPTDMQAREFMGILAADYRSLSEGQKEKYKKLSQDDMTRVAKARADNPLTEPLKKKRPLSGYNIFLQEKFSSHHVPGEKAPLGLLKVAEAWSALTSDEKKVYMDRVPAKVDKVRTRALSGYNFFCKEQLENRKEGDRAMDAMRKMAGQWQQLDAQARKPYEELAAADRLKLTSQQEGPGGALNA